MDSGQTHISSGNQTATSAATIPENQTTNSIARSPGIEIAASVVTGPEGVRIWSTTASLPVFVPSFQIRTKQRKPNMVSRSVP